MIHRLIIVILVVATACTDSSPSENILELAEPSDPAADVVVDRVLTGAGLPGLPGYRATMLSAGDAERLLSLAYPDQAASLISISDGEGGLYNARPLVAFRTDERTVLLVQNQSAYTCHACGGRTSVFYFDTAGSRLTASFPLMLEGADWGEPQEVKLIDVDGPALLLRWDYQQMGYYGAGYNLFRLGQSRIEPLAQFPSLRSNGGTSENLIYEVRLAGAELSGDRRRVILRYVGHLTNQATGGVRTIEDEQTVTLDGTHDAWIENWGIESW